MHVRTPIDGHRARCRKRSDYWVAAWQLPELTHIATSEHVAGWPSSVQPQPNCEHQACCVRAIDLYTSDELLTRVPVVAQADSSAHSTSATNFPL